MTSIEALKQRKKETGITFDELAEKTGISRRAICSLFSGETENPRIDTIQAIEQALGLSDTPASLSDDERELLSLFTEAEKKLGKAYVQGVKQMVRIAIATKP